MYQDPERIGRYRVIGVLGQGAMGKVFLAEDPRLKRKVAIKVVRTGADFDQALERFNREAEISAQLNHPNVITVFDVGEDPKIGIFLAMEYVKGSSLAHLIRHQRPPTEKALDLLIQAGSALGAAEEAGIIHRDIKPENMLVSEDGRLKLMDFGIARGGDSRLTATGVVLGTIAFLAPEILMGHEANFATDRYALVVTAFELMSGKLPYAGDSMGVTLYRVVNAPPTIPEDLPSAVAQVFLKALAKDPKERHVSIRDFLEELIGAYELRPTSKLRLLGKLGVEHIAADSLDISPAPPSELPTTIVTTPLPLEPDPDPFQSISSPLPSSQDSNLLDFEPDLSEQSDIEWNIPGFETESSKELSSPPQTDLPTQWAPPIIPLVSDASPAQPKEAPFSAPSSMQAQSETGNATPLPRPTPTHKTKVTTPDELIQALLPANLRRAARQAPPKPSPTPHEFHSEDVKPRPTSQELLATLAKDLGKLPVPGLASQRASAESLLDELAQDLGQVSVEDIVQRPTTGLDTTLEEMTDMELIALTASRQQAEAEALVQDLAQDLEDLNFGLEETGPKPSPQNASRDLLRELEKDLADLDFPSTDHRPKGFG